MGITIGQHRSLQSKVLGETRHLLVYLPPSYETSTASYPVLYLLDGDSHFHHVTGVLQFLSSNLRVPEMILVAIPNTDRGRDLTPPTADTGLGYHSGGADAFLRFLGELAPWVAKNFRVEPFRILVGHSFGGLFVLHVLLQRPESFNGYIAVSPSLWWNHRALVKRAAELERFPPGRLLYMTMGNENPTRMLEPIQELVSLWERRRPDGLEWRYRFMESDDHGTTPHRSVYDGLEGFFADWRLPDSLVAGADLASAEAHYAKLSTEYGFRVNPPERVVEAIGRVLLRRREVDQAIAVFRRNVELYPGSANARASLGDGLEAAGRLEQARAAYQTAAKRARQLGDSRADWYGREVKRLRRQADAQSGVP